MCAKMLNVNGTRKTLTGESSDTVYSIKFGAQSQYMNAHRSPESSDTDRCRSHNLPFIHTSECTIDGVRYNIQIATIRPLECNT